MKKSRLFSALCACVILSNIFANLATAGTVSINPKNTYLLTNAADASGDAIPIMLSNHNIYAGDVIEFDVFGDWHAGTGSDINDSTLGIFSSSATLLSSSVLNRVQDAIDAGIYATTGNNLYNDITDVPYDFRITDGLLITVPTGATHLFVSPSDSLFFDNSDPDSDYAVSLQTVPVPAAVWLFGSGLLGLVGIARRKKTA